MNEQIVDYKSLQGKYITDPAIQEKHIAMLINDIGGRSNRTWRLLTAIAIHLGGDITIKSD